MKLNFASVLAFSALAYVSPAARAQNACTEFLIDGSGSMNDPFESDKVKTPKIDSARDALLAEIGSLETQPGDRVGLYEFGFKPVGNDQQKTNLFGGGGVINQWAASRSLSCTDLGPLVDMGPVDFSTAAIARVVSTMGSTAHRKASPGSTVLVPQGGTPLAKSIYGAGQALKDCVGPKKLVVVSDGAEKCGGDACAAIKKLRAEGLDFQPVLVPLGDYKGKAEERFLDCFKNEVNGQIVSAKTSAELAPAIHSALHTGVQIHSGSKTYSSDDSPDADNILLGTQGNVLGNDHAKNSKVAEVAPINDALANQLNGAPMDLPPAQASSMNVDAQKVKSRRNGVNGGSASDSDVAKSIVAALPQAPAPTGDPLKDGIAALEMRYFQHAYDGQMDKPLLPGDDPYPLPDNWTDPTARLDRLDTRVFGEPKTGTNEQRLKNLQKVAADNPVHGQSDSDAAPAAATHGGDSAPPAQTLVPEANALPDPGTSGASGSTSGAGSHAAGASPPGTPAAKATPLVQSKANPQNLKVLNAFEGKLKPGVYVGKDDQGKSCHVEVKNDNKPYFNTNHVLSRFQVVEWSDADISHKNCPVPQGCLAKFAQVTIGDPGIVDRQKDAVLPVKATAKLLTQLYSQNESLAPIVNYYGKNTVPGSDPNSLKISVEQLAYQYAEDFENGRYKVNPDGRYLNANGEIVKNIGQGHGTVLLTQKRTDLLLDASGKDLTFDLYDNIPVKGDTTDGKSITNAYSKKFASQKRSDGLVSQARCLGLQPIKPTDAYVKFNAPDLLGTNVPSAADSSSPKPASDSAAADAQSVSH